MKIVVFGLTISSSWGNGHATLWRGLCRALAARGHRVVFFERDVSYYAGYHRDLHDIPGGALHLFADWASVRPLAERELADADAGLVSSYCPDGRAACDLVLSSPAWRKVFYDLDTPVTLGELRRGAAVFYLPPAGLGDFDLVLSYTGGRALDELRERLHAQQVAALYGWVDPDVHRPVPPAGHYCADLSYLGTYAEDRQSALDRLLVEPARRLPERRFVIGGAQYPQTFPWTSNIFFVRHLPPEEHPAFFSSSRLTLNVTRQAMAEMGYCPSGRLFEAAACGIPILSDEWEGLDTFFEPGTEILVGQSSEDAIAGIERSDGELSRMARAARERTLQNYTAERRAAEFESLLEGNGSHSPALEIADAVSC